MSNCGCKQGNNFKIPEGAEVIEAKMDVKTNKVVKWSIFLLLAVLSPIYAPIIVSYALYKGLIDSERLDAVLMIKAISRAAKDIVTKDEEEEERRLEIAEELADIEKFGILELDEVA